MSDVAAAAARFSINPWLFKPNLNELARFSPGLCQKGLSRF
jgi:Rps23 Pro-64 3,4-dihydroxylase Tpa1-like proline 4-hydroxylase